MRAYAPSIAQGEGMSLGEWRIGVFLCVPSPSISSVKKASSNIKLLQINYIFQIFLGMLRCKIFERIMFLSS
jgi:hypothetical protein